MRNGDAGVRDGAGTVVTARGSDEWAEAVRRRWLATTDGAAAEPRWLEPMLAAAPGWYRGRHGVQGAGQVLEDLRRLAALGSQRLDLRLYTQPDSGDPEIADRRRTDHRLALYLDAPATLSELMPILGHLDIEVVDEHPTRFERPDAGACWLYDMGVRLPVTPAGPADGLVDRLTGAVRAAWTGDAESDRFSALVLHAGLHWREAALLRAYARYGHQVGTAFGTTYVADQLIAHPEAARALVGLFRERFDPAAPAEPGGAEAADAALTDLDARIDAVASLDADRILRGLRDLVLATRRTNWFSDRPVLALKIDPRDVPGMPKPVPRHEIFVYSPQVEGVHLRLGSVARGGLRHSDRPKDYRTEVLGLVKSQGVKNAVIVPVGAKGGFVVRAPDPSPEHVRECYRAFVGGLLDVTDDLRPAPDGGTRIVPPPGVVRRDGDDPYLVVAADKGTATYSDLANEVAVERGFWLGDAFASGGSVGYDHKAMGITARGAWESVVRHFAELGRDANTDPLTVVGIGDMSGDVFGNGMLCSEHLRLVAAFDHRHVFLDPDPDPARSFAERRRLFALPRSSWADYDPALLSPGGGVWPRTAKSVPIAPQVRAVLGLPETVSALSPPELIRAILTAPVDLLWNGGIGTYIKASTQTHAQVGDAANVAIRVDGRDLRARVVAEGGNLGATQAGRVEYARAGGRINTDAIDNSAGVDCSDHEVNVKILLDRLVADGALDRGTRDRLLATTTDEVARLVLADNVAQNTALGVARSHAEHMVGVHGRLLADLVERTGLDCEVEGLPTPAECADRAEHAQGLCAPELATLLAHTKIDLTRRLLASGPAPCPAFEHRLRTYFPEPLRGYRDAIAGHQLHREITATALVNEMVDRAGISYAFRLTEALGSDADDAVRAYCVVAAVFDLERTYGGIRDCGLPTAEADALVLRCRRLLDRAARWFLTRRPQPLDVDAEIARFAEPVRSLLPRLPDLLVGRWAQEASQAGAGLHRRGVRTGPGVAAASIVHAFGLLDVVELSPDPAQHEPIARLYYALADHLGFDAALDAVARLPRRDRVGRLAGQAVREDLHRSLRLITRDALAADAAGLTDDPAGDPAATIARWERGNAARVCRARASLSDLEPAGGLDLASLTVVSRHLRGLVP